MADHRVGKLRDRHSCDCVQYNSRKVLFFCASEGASATIDCEPSTTKWPDKHDNMQNWHVLRLVLCSRYFSLSNKVDRQNHLRQHELAMLMIVGFAFGV